MSRRLRVGEAKEVAANHGFSTAGHVRRTCIFGGSIATSTYVRVNMRLLTMGGRVVARHSESLFMVDGLKENGKWRLRFNLPAGRYLFEVRATDEAGNAQVKIGRSVLVVRP
jgi:hypothetical protein